MKTVALLRFFSTSLVTLTLLALIVVQPITAQLQENYQTVQSVPASRLNTPPLDAAFQHLEQVLDKYHQSFAVYTDIGDAGNHFVHRASMGRETGSSVTINDGATESVYSGATAIKNTFTGPSSSWGGWTFQNGVLLDGTFAPQSNWGDFPDTGYNLTGATQLTFWARGEQGGERVEFFAFGVGRDIAGNPAANYPDSSPKITSCGLNASCYVTLTNVWQRYTIDLTGLDLSYVIGGFGWVTNAVQNNNQSIVFFLDNIQYNLPRLNEPRFLLSFETLPTSKDFDLINRNVAFLYDNALALIALTAAEKQEHATLLADAFVYALEHDRFYKDGRLRNAYQAGDLTTPPGWVVNSMTNTARLPGWTDPQTGSWVESKEHVGSGTGNLAWAMLALLNYYDTWGGDKYLKAVITLGEWIEANVRDSRGPGGYIGGYNSWEPTPEPLLWKSTEHNLDLYVVFERLFLITHDPRWHERAQHARNLVEAMWDETDGIYWTGTGLDGETIIKQPIPLDGQTWSLMAFGPNERTLRAIHYPEIHHIANFAYSGGVYEGFDFNDDRDMPWAEGTGQMVVSYWLVEENDKALYYLNELYEIQATEPNGNGKGLVAAPKDGLTTGFDWEYFQRLHIGATSWFIFAELKLNPYWPSGMPANQPPIAKFNAPATANKGDSIPLDASESSDPDGTIVLYEWDLDNDGLFDNANGPTATVVFNNVGSYAIGLRVTDDQGTTAQTLKSITINQDSETIILLSSNTSGSVNQVKFNNEDILAFNVTTRDWRMFFDGSDVGLSKANVDCFDIVNPDAEKPTLILSFDKAIKIPGLGLVDDSDIVAFMFTALSGPNTTGTFAWYFDGSDVGLDKSGEDMDACDLTADGKLILSTTGSFSVPGLSGQDEDLFVFAPNLGGLGSDGNTSGTFTLLLDGTELGLTKGSEDVKAVWLDPLKPSDVYMATAGSFAVNSGTNTLSGKGNDIFGCSQTSIASCSALFLLFSGSGAGFAKSIDGFNTIPSASVTSSGLFNNNHAVVEGEDASVQQYDVVEDEIDNTDLELDEFDINNEDVTMDQHIFLPVVNQQ